MRVNPSRPISDDQVAPPGILRIYLVRHGITSWNVEQRLQGHTDIPLTEEGILQAKHIADRLSVLALEAVWSSDLVRAYATADAIARRHGLYVNKTPLLRESGLGDWEGLTEAEIMQRGERDLWLAYRRDSTAHRPPGGEPYQAVWDRLMEVRDRIVAAHPRGNVVIVGHGGSMRSLLTDALGAGIPGIRRLSLDNASLSLIERTADWTIVRFVNDTGHLLREA